MDDEKIVASFLMAALCGLAFGIWQWNIAAGVFVFASWLLAFMLLGD